MSTSTIPVPLRVKAGYGAAEIGMSAVEVMLQLYILAFYTQTVGLEPKYAGIALALAVLWDALVDPAIGAISDQTRSAWGKRRPFIFAGAIALSLSFVAIYTPPPMQGQGAKFLFLLFGFMLVNTSMTLINVPHSALGGEISFDRNVRTELFGWRLLFKNVGFLMAAMLPGILLRLTEGTAAGADDHSSRSYASMIIAAATLASAFVTFHVTRPYDASRARDRISWGQMGGRIRTFLRSLWQVSTNRMFMPLLLAYGIAFIGRTMNASLALFYYEIRLKFDEFETGVYILGLFMLCLSVSVFLWMKISRRWGKKMPAFYGALLLGLITCVIYPLLPPGELLPAIFFVSILSGSLVGSIILFDSLVADIVDYDELRTGQHREGLYFGCWLMVTKIARAAGLVATGWLLQAIGFDEGAIEHPPEIGFRIALLFGPGVGLMFILAALVFLWMPLTDARHRRIQALLKRRQTYRAFRAKS